jgi:hypothetical protein
VRLSVNPKAMWQHNDAEEIPAEYLTYLDKAVKMILEEDLVVVIDIHPDGDFKEKLTNDALPRWRRGGSGILDGRCGITAGDLAWWRR